MTTEYDFPQSMVGVRLRPDIPSRARRYPDRKRCYACRDFLDFIVVDLLFCSWECAGRDEAIQKNDPEAGLRQCINSARWGNRPKKRYLDHETALDARRKLHGRRSNEIGVYECGICHFFHLGHKRAEVVAEETAERQRMLEEAIPRLAARRARQAALRARQGLPPDTRDEFGVF